MCFECIGLPFVKPAIRFMGGKRRNSVFGAGRCVCVILLYETTEHETNTFVSISTTRGDLVTKY